MKKKYLIVGLFSIFFGIGYSFGLGDGFYHNTGLGLISFVYSGNVVFTVQDKDLGATCFDVNSDCSRGNLYQRGNNYGFSSVNVPNNISNSLYNLSNYQGSSFNSNGVFYSGYVVNSGLTNGIACWGDNSLSPSVIPGSSCYFILNSPCPSGFIPGVPQSFFDSGYADLNLGFDFGSSLFMRSYNLLSNNGFVSNSSYLYHFYGSRYAWTFNNGVLIQPGIMDFSNFGNIGFDYLYDFPDVGYGLPVRCFKNSVVVPDNSWIYYQSPCNDLNGKTGTISIIESDLGTYYTLTLGDGTACTLPNDFGLSGGAIQIQNNNTWSGTITIVDDSYITYTDLSGNIILITTGYDVNKGTWQNILTAFSGHQLTIYETDQGTYYTFVDSNGQIKTADVNGVFQYLNEQLQFTGLQTGSYNMMTANRWYGQMLDKGRHFFQCGVDYGTKNIFSARVSDYYYVAKVVDKLDTNLLGFMLCPFYSLLAGISDNFDNSTMMRSGYKPVLAHTGYFDFGSSVNRGKFYSFFDASLIFVIFITYGSIFYFIIRKF